MSSPSVSFNTNLLVGLVIAQVTIKHYSMMNRFNVVSEITFTLCFIFTFTARMFVSFMG